MHESKSPAFQFYPKDFLSDEKQIRMSLSAVGIYVRLICHCWIEGSLPAEEGALARLAGTTKRQLRAVWPSVQPCFQTNADGRLVNPRLDRERRKQNTFRHDVQSNLVNNVDRDKRAKEEKNAGLSAPVHHNRAPSSSSSSFASAKYKYTPPANVSVSQEIAEKAARFLERYQCIYAEERRGAHFPLKPVLHFQTACELVQGWPDLKRLELMLRTFCKLPASEKMAWPGTPAQFKHLAPAIDARLRQAGV